MLGGCRQRLARSKRHLRHVPQRRANNGAMFPDYEVYRSLLGCSIDLAAAANHRAHSSRLPSLLAQLLPLPWLSTGTAPGVLKYQLDSHTYLKFTVELLDVITFGQTKSDKNNRMTTINCCI